MKKTNLIIGLLINAEMERQSIQKEDRDSIQKLILRLIENNSSTMLSVSGLKLLNSYATGGMNVIRESIPKTSELEAFLVLYHDLINSKQIS